MQSPVEFRPPAKACVLATCSSLGGICFIYILFIFSDGLYFIYILFVFCMFFVFSGCLLFVFYLYLEIGLCALA